MRLVTFSTNNGSARAGILSGERVLPLDPPVREILAAGLGNLPPRGEPIALARVRLHPPVPDPQKIICVGQNYRDHCAEQNLPVPERPIIFAKFATSLAGPRDPIVLPRISAQIDFEIELAFVIGKGGKHIARESALEHVAGYMIFNDVTARDIQFGDKQWVRGKSCDTFAPCGPALVTPDEVPDPHALALELRVNGVVMQKSNTNQMIFRVPELIAFLSQTITLTPGDIISTGTPPGVGVFRKPPVFLKPGDKVTCVVEKLGSLENACVAE
jgi:2-keto-4-pentenoate hydratase/2-oxohepta-3-ene-1,7-dioic acid hydratase in catechol pathway